MRFLIDAQLPPSLAMTLREHGLEAAHVYELLPSDARDQAIWSLALKEGYVLVTKDEDFAEWSRLRQPTPAVLWLRLGNLKKAKLRVKLSPLLPELLRRLEAGETLIEVF
jgi:predicted nuclease of predicted toxin-antitoxin system